MIIDISTAIASLRPNTAFSVPSDVVSEIIWHTEGVEPITQAEVEAEMQRLEQAQADAIAAKEAARASAVAKLSALGLDADEVAALLSV